METSSSSCTRRSTATASTTRGSSPRCTRRAGTRREPEHHTQVGPDQLDHAVDRLLSGDFTVTERMVLQVVVHSEGPAGGRWWALNEAVLEKVNPGRIIRVAVDINGAFFTTYAADGVIIST